MINIFRSIFYSLIGLTVIGWLSVLLISIMLVGPKADSALVQYFADTIIVSEKLEGLGYQFYEVSKNTFEMIAHMLTSMLFTTILFSIVWSAGSHYLNIDAPGKAKIYFIHWIIFTGIFVAILFLISYFFLRQASPYEAADLIKTTGRSIIVLLSVIYFFLMYYLSVLIGTARFARSSVLLANKLPGNL